jgi:hypothetical protein
MATLPLVAASLILGQEALEEVRVVSAQSRDESQAARAKGQALRAHSAHLLERSAAACERLGQFLPPPPDAIREAERPILAMFRVAPPPPPR